MSRLVLTRRAGQSVNIGSNLVLTIREVHPKRVWASVDTDVDRSVPSWYELRKSIEIPSEFGTIKITVSEINRGHVKLVFDADRSVTIMRSELLPS